MIYGTKCCGDGSFKNLIPDTLTQTYRQTKEASLASSSEDASLGKWLPISPWNLARCGRSCRTSSHCVFKISLSSIAQDRAPRRWRLSRQMLSTSIGLVSVLPPRGSIGICVNGSSLPTPQRNPYTQPCVCWEMVNRLERLQSNIHYCY